MQEKEIVDSLRSLHDLAKAINSTLDIHEVVKMVLGETAKLMHSPRVLLLLLDKEKSTLAVHDSLGFAQGDLPVRSFHDIRPFDHCIVHKGTVITLAEVLSPDDRRTLRDSMPFLFEMFFAPLEIQSEAYGLLGVTGAAHEFSMIELEIFCSLASQAAVAIENANLYQRLKETFLHTAAALAEAVNSRDPYTGGHPS